MNVDVADEIQPALDSIAPIVDIFPFQNPLRI
jgi:hypothetical protein